MCVSVTASASGRSARDRFLDGRGGGGRDGGGWSEGGGGCLGAVVVRPWGWGKAWAGRGCLTGTAGGEVGLDAEPPPPPPTELPPPPDEEPGGGGAVEGPALAPAPG